MKIAVFDVCDTLYSVNTTFSFLDNYLIENKKYLFFRRISKLFTVKIANYFIYKFLKIDLIRIYATTFLKGKSHQEIEDYSHKFVHTFLVSKIKESVRDMLQQYKSDGYTIVLMSGSYEFIINSVSDYIHADYFFASKLKENSAIYEGKYQEDILLSKHKLLENKFPYIEELIVVSDNKTDLSLMQMADSAYAICNREKDCIFWEKYPNISLIKEF